MIQWWYAHLAMGRPRFDSWVVVGETEKTTQLVNVADDDNDDDDSDNDSDDDHDDDSDNHNSDNNDSKDDYNDNGNEYAITGARPSK